MDEVHVDGPVLVVGGGPSVPSDMKQLEGVEFAAVISANDHGFIAFEKGLCPKPDFILVGDEIHSETREPQEPKMRAYGVPIIARHGFADYRLNMDTCRLDSGMTAIVAAHVLGGSPIYPVGIDCWIGEATYFHAPNADVVCRRQHARRLPMQLEILKGLTQGADVRPQSGLLRLVF